MLPWSYRSEPSYQISPDGQTVVYLADQAVNDRFEIYAVDIAGTPPVVLNGPLVQDGGVGGPLVRSSSFPPFQITPDGREVVYLADQDRNDIVELYASPLP